MGRLSDILRDGDDGRLRRHWDEVDEATDFSPLPPGEYVAHITNGELATSRRKQTPCYKLSFVVLEGECEGRRFWHDVWLTEAALPMAKRDLAKLGVTQLDQLEQPLPRGIRCKARLVIQRDDDGNECSKVKRFEVLGIDEPPADPFAPAKLNAPDDDVAKSQTQTES